jgi:bifunctional DNA-binding transcriptional regulator/antitoxin component of YhaV-PrlF toxin-antitoxin module
VTGDITRSERKLARTGHALLRQKRQITVPKRPCAEAGLKVGDRMRFRADGPGRIVFERAEASEVL